MLDCTVTPVVCPSSKKSFQDTCMSWKCKCTIELAVTCTGQGWDLHNRLTSFPADFTESVTACYPEVDALERAVMTAASEVCRGNGKNMCTKCVQSGSKPRVMEIVRYLWNNGLCTVYCPAEMEFWSCSCHGSSRSVNIYQGPSAHIIQNIWNLWKSLSFSSFLLAIATEKSLLESSSNRSDGGVDI